MSLDEILCLSFYVQRYRWPTEAVFQAENRVNRTDDFYESIFFVKVKLRALLQLSIPKVP